MVIGAPVFFFTRFLGKMIDLFGFRLARHTI